MLAGKEFDDVGSTKVGGATMPELEPIPQFGGFRSMSKSKLKAKAWETLPLISHLIG